jgi:hypothetical protein
MLVSALKAPEPRLKREGSVWRLLAVQFDAQMMRCDGGLVNEMEFRMWRGREAMSPSQHVITMEGFSGMFRQPKLISSNVFQLFCITLVAFSIVPIG